MRSSMPVGVFVSSSVVFAVLCCPEICSQEFEVKSIVAAVKLAWDSDFSHAYQVWRASSPQGPWEKVGEPLDGFDGEMCAYDDNVPSKTRFYRIERVSNAPAGMVPIPGGTYEMGDHFGVGYANERPIHTVHVDSFFMDAKEVTNEQYCTFLNSLNERGVLSGQWGPGPNHRPTVYVGLGWDIWYDSEEDAYRVSPGRGKHPAVAVTWFGAIAYCSWRSSQEGLMAWFDFWEVQFSFAADGYRLPTEAEWVYGARGDLRYARYPWGDEIDGTRANFWDSGDPYEHQYPHTTPVAYYSPNSYGLFDMAGNAAEWCFDFYDKDYYRYCIENNIVDNPTGREKDVLFLKDSNLVRGGSSEWGIDELRCSSRDSYDGGSTAGFRCVRRPRPR